LRRIIVGADATATNRDFYTSGEHDVHRTIQASREEEDGFGVKGVYHRPLRCEPDTDSGDGAIKATIDYQTAVCHRQNGNEAEVASINRFGLINVLKSADADPHPALLPAQERYSSEHLVDHGQPLIRL
jgi:hypothetical protein